jgi:hypothetical protein
LSREILTSNGLETEMFVLSRPQPLGMPRHVNVEADRWLAPAGNGFHMRSGERRKRWIVQLSRATRKVILRCCRRHLPSIRSRLTCEAGLQSPVTRDRKSNQIKGKEGLMATSILCTAANICSYFQDMQHTI